MEGLAALMAATPAPAATVVLLREAAERPELLLLQRAARRDGRPGPWVFPGGKVETHEHEAAAGDALDAARRAGVRETAEEAGLALDPARLAYISRWITPEIAPRRFDTWFFLSVIDGSAPVRVDGREITAHRWLAAPDALAAHHNGEISLAPPTFVTVAWIAEHDSARAAHQVLGAAEPIVFRPRICRIEDGVCMLYPGDAGYEAGDHETPGRRHRVWSTAVGYRYERTST